MGARGSVAQAQSPAPSASRQQPAPPSAHAPTPAAPVPPSGAASQPTDERKVTAYTLPPDRDEKARRLARLANIFVPVTLVYDLLVLVVVLRLKAAPQYRNIAERVSSRRFVQGLIFTPLLFFTIDVVSLPTEVFRNHVRRNYGLSVQSWASWFGDWAKGEFLSILLITILAWILYSIIRKSPLRWWFYFWLISIPIFLGILFLQPYVIDPLYSKFEPLQIKNPALTAELEKMVHRAGQSIPPDHMFWMGASERTTALNAYVAGFSASKRIVVWDTLIAKMNTPQTVYVTAHELGHYVLGHVPKTIAFYLVLLFAFFYLTYRFSGAMLRRWGPSWQIRDLGDWASLPALALLLTVLFYLATPITCAFGRYREHQADQYGLEVVHGLIPDANQVAAQAFQILGEVNLATPQPNPVFVFFFYDHPPIADRVRFAIDYDPWSQGRQPEFVK
jgi:Zn-dependent protease with chaperone function